MKFFYKIFIIIFLILAIGVGLFGYWLVDSENNDRKKIIESELGKVSKLFSSQLSSLMKDGAPDSEYIGKTLDNLRDKIPDINKETGKFNAVVADSNGNVIYDSSSKGNLGKNIYITPEDVASSDVGEIWSSRIEKNKIFGTDESEAIPSERYSLRVPVRNKDHIVGVVAVSKSLEESENIIKITKEIIFKVFAGLILLAFIIARFFSYLVTRSTRGLIKYAEAVAGGENARPPTTPFPEYTEMGKAFEEMRTTLQKTERIKIYVSEVVHALKTPLTTIKSAAEILKDEIPEDKGRLFSHIESETGRASKSLDDLLELVKAEGQRELKEKRKLSIKELIEEILCTFEPVITQKKIQVEFEFGSNKTVITGEEKTIRRTLEEMVSNAIDFSPNEGKVEIKIAEDKNKVEIFIRDQGPGVPDYAKEKIFNMFYSLKRPDGKKSSGLGLAFAKEIILMHNGEINLEPSSNKMCGANFKVSFIKS